MSLTRKKPIKRCGPLRRTAMKKRRQSRAQLERIYGSPEFRAWIHSLPCQLCGVVGFTQQAHVGKHAMGKRLDWTHTTALCGPFSIAADHAHGKSRAMEGCHQKFDQRKLDEHQRAIVIGSVGTVQAAWQRIKSTPIEHKRQHSARSVPAEGV